jgi:calcium-dependent protein kinase
LGKYSFERKVWLSISVESKDLISNMLAYNPKNRITAENALKSPWFQKFYDHELHHSSVNRALNNLKHLDVIRLINFVDS